MKSLITRFSAALLLIPLGGCVQQAALIEVNPDGSGQVIVRYLFSERGDASLSLFAVGSTKGKDDADDGDGKKSSWSAKQIDKVRDRLPDVARQMGEGVKLVNQQAIEKDGWVGIQATYSVADVSKLRFQGSQQPSSEASPEEKQPEEKQPEEKQPEEKQPEELVAGAAMPITFDFKKGRVSELTIKLGKPASANGSAGNNASDSSDPFEKAGLKLKPSSPDLVGSMAAGLVKAALRDARMTIMVKVNGRVVQSNAKHRLKENSLFLLDFDLGKFVESPVFDRAMAERWDFERMLDESVPGLRGQQPGDTVRVTFRP